MVVTVRPVAAEIGVWHERTALPSRCTVQAPHCPMPQPNLVPVRPIESRRTQRSGVSAATVTVCDRPLTRMVNDGMGFGLRCDVCVLVYGRCAVNATGLAVGLATEGGHVGPRHRFSITGKHVVHARAEPAFRGRWRAASTITGGCDYAQEFLVGVRPRGDPRWDRRGLLRKADGDVGGADGQSERERGHNHPASR